MNPLNVETLIGGLTSMLTAALWFWVKTISDTNREAARERDEIRQELAALQAALPREYVLRDDYIRNQAVLEAKMDGIHKTLTDLYKIESVKKS